MSEASDLAAAKHESLREAASQLGKAYNGSGKALKEFGITMEKSADLAKNLAKATKESESADKDLATAKQHLIEVTLADGEKKKLTALDALKLKEAQDKVHGATMTAAQAHQHLATAQTQATTVSKGHAKELDELGKS